MFQKTVNTFSAPGIPGDFYDNSPRRVQPAIIADGTAKIGSPVFFVGGSSPTDPLMVTSTWTSGAKFAGIVVNGKELVRKDGLTAGLEVAEGTVVSVCTMGRVWVEVKSLGASVGAKLYFNDVSKNWTDQNDAEDIVDNRILFPLGDAGSGYELTVIELG